MKLIDKDALVTEINAFKKDAYRTWKWDTFHTLNKLLSFINTLEVKEMDLEEEIESWRHNHFHGRRDKEASGEYLERVSQLALAKHFFELGIQVSNKSQKEEKV